MEKTAGLADIVMVMISALNDFGMDRITEVINEIYDSYDILEDISTFIFASL